MLFSIKLKEQHENTSGIRYNSMAVCFCDGQPNHPRDDSLAKKNDRWLDSREYDVDFFTAEPK